MSARAPLSVRDQWIKRIIKILLWLPALGLVLAAVTNDLTANPIQAAIQRTGITAIILLGLSLACTPVKLITGWPVFSALRKIFGLAAFYYAAGHLVIFAALDYGLDIARIAVDAAGKPYIIAGLVVFLILLAMAVTSNKPSKAKLGKNWKRLHRLVYLAAPLAGLHFAWALKGDLFSLRGNIFWPTVYLGIVFVLLAMRIPPVRRFLSKNTPVK